MQIGLPRVSRGLGYARSTLSGYGARRGYGRYRSKWATFNSRTNPVYPRPEVKNFDANLASIAIPQPILAAGAITVLNEIAQGTDDENRIGRSTATKSVYYNFVLNFGTGAVPNCIRHMLVWDRQSNGVAPAVTAILDVNSQPVTAPLELDNRQRFVVLADERYTLSPNGDQIRFCSGFRNINQKTTWADGVDVPSTGALLLLMVSDEATVANQPTFYGTWRTRFIDN